MEEVKWEYSKAEYEEFKKLEAEKKLNAEFSKNRISDSIRYGYGFYGVRLREENGKYYAILSIGSTCD